MVVLRSNDSDVNNLGPIDRAVVLQRRGLLRWFKNQPFPFVQVQSKLPCSVVFQRMRSAINQIGYRLCSEQFLQPHL